jgi:hypothetical protein
MGAPGADPPTGVPVVVSTAGKLAALPRLFLNTARNSSPFCAKTAMNVKLRPRTPRMFRHVAPSLAEICHCARGLGYPEAAATNRA